MAPQKEVGESKSGSENENVKASSFVFEGNKGGELRIDLPIEIDLSK